jgi:triosephosphate isomerase
MAESKMLNSIHAPVFIVNFKSYIWGAKALDFSRKLERATQRSEAYLCLMPQIVDIPLLAKEIDLPIFSPHVDCLTPGRGTGHILPEAVKEAGAVGVFMNHAENPISLDVIFETVKRTREVGLITMVASSSPEETQMITKIEPEVIVSELPTHIGTLKSIGRNKEFVLNTIIKVKNFDSKIIVVFGGGVSSGKDVKELVTLGAEGTGASRAIFEAKDPVGKAKEMVEALESEWNRSKKK